jgi:lipoprotein-releasing system permease protein
LSDVRPSKGSEAAAAAASARPEPGTGTSPAHPERSAAGGAAESRGHPAPPVFSRPSFVLALVGVLGTPFVFALGLRLFGSRLGLPGAAATGTAALAAFLAGAAAGAIAGAIGRRLAFYEIAVAALLWMAIAALGVLALPALRGGPLDLSGLEAQGKLVVVLALAGVGILAATAVFVGSSLAYIVLGTGRLDASFGYELFVARSHLKLSPRTLLALFGMVVTGLVPGLLVLLGWSFWRDAAERRAYRRGELSQRARMPATLLMTLISIGGVAIGVWALTVVLSVMSGFEADLKRKILGHNAHGMVLAYGQDDFKGWQAVRQRVLAVPGVVGVTPFLYSEVMLSAGDDLTGAILKAIDPATIGTVTELPRSVEDGKLDWLRDPGAIPPAGRAGAAAAPREAAPGASGRHVLPGIVLGRELARQLRLAVGDEVNVVSPLGDLGPAGPQPKSRPFRIAAIFYSGMYEYDSKFAYVDLAAGQRFFGMADSITGLELKVKDVDTSRAVMARVLYELGGFPYRVKDWSELNRSLFSALMMEKVVMAVILGFIVLVASFIIVATLIMLVLEKSREIAVLKSMGAGVPSIMKIFVVEGVVIGAIGTAFGLLLGLGTCLLVDRVGIPLDPEVYYISNLPVLVDGSQFALVALTALAISYLATIYPATKASRLRPVDGLRSE